MTETVAVALLLGLLVLIAVPAAAWWAKVLERSIDHVHRRVLARRRPPLPTCDRGSAYWDHLAADTREMAAWGRVVDGWDTQAQEPGGQQ